MTGVAYENDLFDMLERYIDRDPRTLQKQIGPSGLGTDCFHCLGAMLNEEPKAETSQDRWLTFIGKCVHDGMAAACEYDNQETVPVRWRVEERVTVGTLSRGKPWQMTIEGNADAYDLWRNRVVDWKVVGDNTLRKVGYGDVPFTYQRQVQLYGAGFENDGITPEGCTIMFLPRNRYRLRDGIPVHYSYDRSIADEAMKRASDILDLLNLNTPEYVLPRLKRAAGCMDCPRYAR